jgi:hypothetical protein
LQSPQTRVLTDYQIFAAVIVFIVDAHIAATGASTREGGNHVRPEPHDVSDPHDISEERIPTALKRDRVALRDLGGSACVEETLEHEQTSSHGSEHIRDMDLSIGIVRCMGTFLGESGSE